MSKTLIAYFSHPGETYSNGGIRFKPVGNTEIVAKKLQGMTNSDLFYIDTVKDYPKDYIEKIEVAKKEFEENVRPALKGRVENMDEYDTIVLAYPNWWTTMPMALFTFLESYDFSGKRICPIVTHGGSGFSNSLEDIKKLCLNSTITEGLAINGDNVEDSDLDLKVWANKINLK